MTLIAIGKAGAAALAKKFGAAIIERWTRHRAERFFEAFLEELRHEPTDEETDKHLEEILNDDIKSEVLFDAYRRVCFSKSKTIGPRIIGRLTGELVNEGQMASDSEEAIFAAAERLSDGDIVEFMKYYHEHRTKAENATDDKGEHRMSGGDVIIRWNEERLDSSGYGHSEIDIGSFPWKLAFGHWAVELKQCGLLEERVIQTFGSDRSAWESERVIHNRVKTEVIFSSTCLDFYQLAERSLGVKPFEEKQSEE
jgi:hypothetical protein